MRAIENTIGVADAYFCERLRDRLVSNKKLEPDVPSFLHTMAETTLPAKLWGFGITLTQCHEEPLTVVRVGNTVSSESIRGALNALQSHRRLPSFLVCDPRVCTITIDFIPNRPTAVKLEYASGLPALFESQHGLRIIGGSDRLYIFPWQWHSLGLQSRESFAGHLTKHFDGREPAMLEVFAFESLAFQKKPSGWINPTVSRHSPEQVGTPMTLSPGSECNQQLGWARLRSLLATQHASGWLGLQSIAANWPIDGQQVSDAEFANHCQAVVELLKYCSVTEDMSILPQVTAAIDCVFRYLDRSLKGETGASQDWLNAAGTFAKVAEFVQAYEAVTLDFQYLDRLTQLQERTCSVP